MEHLSLKQLKLYPTSSLFLVKAINGEKVKPIKDLSYDDYLKYLKYLKYLNANGFNIFFLPPKGGLWLC